MATHSSLLAWRIPWTEEPGRLQSIGLQRASLNTHMGTICKMAHWCLCNCKIVKGFSLQVLFFLIPASKDMIPFFATYPLSKGTFGLLLLLCFFNWSVADLQCCTNLCCTAQWISYPHVCFWFFKKASSLVLPPSVPSFWPVLLPSLLSLHPPTHSPVQASSWCLAS